MVEVGSGPKLIRKRCLFVILTTVSRDSSYSCDDKWRRYLEEFFDCSFKLPLSLSSCVKDFEHPDALLLPLTVCEVASRLPLSVYLWRGKLTDRDLFKPKKKFANGIRFINLQISNCNSSIYFIYANISACLLAKNMWINTKLCRKLKLSAKC